MRPATTRKNGDARDGPRPLSLCQVCAGEFDGMAHQPGPSHWLLRAASDPHVLSS